MESWIQEDQRLWRPFLTDIWGKEILERHIQYDMKGLYFTSKAGVFWISKVLSGICDVILIWEWDDTEYATI